MALTLADFDFDLPDDRIARFPAERRDDSRLLVLDRTTGTRTHARFADLPRFLAPHDLLVVNDARVLPARLRGKKRGTGGKVELLLVEEVHQPHRWRAMAAASKPLRPGAEIDLGPEAWARIVAAEGEGFFIVELSEDGRDLAYRLGELPLPPYMGREAQALDTVRYQTVYADGQRARSVAAPTAGLHFTPELLEALAARGVGRATLTLDVGPGTFLPVRAQAIDAHVMHEERFSIPPETAARIDATRGQGRVVAVGTTVVRALESAVVPGERRVQAGPGQTRLFVRPGTQIHVPDALITNFHLPRSTLLMLVAAFAGYEPIMDTYRAAVADGYRFFSYGDAMLIL
jgi:S-adenosylmethionine:tRNA ribosyltransferase-isomerase